jgi:hypothetical protein
LELFEENGGHEFCSSMMMFMCRVHGFVGSEICRARSWQWCWNLSSKKLLDPEKDETKWPSGVL